jgi:hypothetical protein
MHPARPFLQFQVSEISAAQIKCAEKNIPIERIKNILKHVVASDFFLLIFDCHSFSTQD